ncbi:MAG: proline racemase family protein [Ignavibacteriaceae bacterium]
MSKKNLDSKKYLSHWIPVNNWLKIKTIDAHTAGEPLRIIIEGFPEIKGKTILEKRKYMKENLDHLRTALMFEPRGHADMYGAIITEPEKDDSDFGVLFLHNEGYSTMCGHGIIALTKVAVQTGMIEAEEPVTKIKIDTPAGLVTAFAKVKNGRVESVYFHNVHSFVLTTDIEFEVVGIGKVKFDIAFGGAFYAFVNADELDIGMKEKNFRELIRKGMTIKNAVMKSYPIKHPFNEDLSFLYGTIFYGKAHCKDADSRNVCIFADGEVDRSPTGTGVSARMALHYAKGEIRLNEQMVIESIIGTKFTGSIHQTTKFGEYDAVIPQVEGNAYITGKHEFIIDPEDPLKEGFIFR